MKQLRNAFDQDHVLLDLDAADITTAIRKSVRHMVVKGILKAEIADRVSSELLQREEDMPTAIGHATAIPHAYVEGLDERVVFFARLSHAVNLGAPDGIPTHFIFFLLGPPGAAAQHLDTLAAVARVMSDDEFRYELGEAKSSKDLSAALEHFQERRAPKKPKKKHLHEGLEYTGRLCGGLRADIARRLPHYKADFKDGLHPKCLGSTLFLFFACLAPAVTFGGLMAVATDNHIGAVEMIVASAFCGIIYALFSGQPLIILGGTGPLLVFTGILYALCDDWGIAFLPAYAWVGFWSAAMLILLSVTDASWMMRYFTRFTDEIFAALISVIFIYQAIKSLVHSFDHFEEDHQQATAFLTLLLALGTFYIAMSLSRFRRSHYLRPRLREFLADFGPAIALAAMTIVAVGLDEIALEILAVPEKFGPTLQDEGVSRSWLVNIWETPHWVKIAAIVPALLGTVLIYLDQNITARVVNSPDHRLQRGVAYHLDLGVVGILIAICSIFGLPWLVAATVRSLNHLRSLATVEEVVGPGGETRERVNHVRENRLTGLAIHVLLGFSLLLLPLLEKIPLAVLYGLFLFMGVVSMSGNQFFERMSLWFKDPALYPVTHYIRRVPRWTIHAFTLLQLSCLAVLWFVKSSSLGILFPIFIALLVPVRMLANRFFSKEHLDALDAEEEPDEEETHWGH